MVSVLSIRVDRSRDEVEPERRAGTQRSKLKTRMIIAVGLALEVVGVDQQNRSACSARQCARLLIDRIAKRLDRPANLFTRLGPNILLVVQHARDGNSCYTSRLRDIVDGRLARTHARKVTSVRCGRNGRVIF